MLLLPHVAEVTFRIEEGILREAMTELTRMRGDSDPENPGIRRIGVNLYAKHLAASS